MALSKVASEIFTPSPTVNIDLWSERFKKWVSAEMIIDTGARISFLPHSYIKNLGIDVKKDSLLYSMATVSGTEKVHIYKNQRIKLGNSESTIPILFLKNDVYGPTLGGQAVRQIIDIPQKELPEGVSKGEIQEMKRLIANNIPEINKKLEQLLNKFSREKPKEMEVKKLEYEIYTDKEIIHNVDTEKIQELRSKKDNFDLFVEWNRQEIYIRNRPEPVNDLKKSPKQWALLADLLEHKGVSGTYEEIYNRIYSAPAKIVGEERAIGQLKYRLNQFFKSHRLSIPRTELNIYKLPNDLKFCMIKEKIRKK